MNSSQLVTTRPGRPRLLADENTSHRFVAACARLAADVPIVHIARGLIVFRRGVRSTNYGEQARLVTDLWRGEGRDWDWTNRIVYLPKSP